MRLNLYLKNKILTEKMGNSCEHCKTYVYQVIKDWKIAALISLMAAKHAPYV